MVKNRMENTKLFKKNRKTANASVIGMTSFDITPYPFLLTYFSLNEDFVVWKL